ncbi:hypothetical protein FBUS_02352 [Fasciolopsis buskii]|uniref:CUB domain-containing protein n=1 Tax=Fasciolopsis buskii TaxID=27845 RepID=A0A8E0VHM4_9TREM|nr:hypothetical protein FBUS_02352 [Fasciolopsis buski]
MIGPNRTCNEAHGFLTVGKTAVEALTSTDQMCATPTTPLQWTNLREVFVHIEGSQLTADDTFTLNYASEKPETLDFLCENTVLLSTDELQSLQVPLNGTRLNQQFNCTYEIMAPGDRSLFLQFDYFVLPKIADCASNYAQIGSGETPVANETKYCDIAAPFDSISETNKMHVNFVLKDLPWGYLVEFQSKEIGPVVCQTEMQAKNDTGTEVLIPDSDHFIPTGYNCTQAIRAGAGKYIQLQFRDFKVGNKSDCVDNYVKVGVGSDPLNISSAKTFCGTAKPDDTIYPGSALSMMIIFNTPQNTDKLSFVAKEGIGCYFAETYY